MDAFKSILNSSVGIFLQRIYSILCIPSKEVVDENNTEKQPFLSWWQIYFFGIAMKIGACTIVWHLGTSAGFWEYYIGFLITTLGYFMLALCMAEMVSIMSFSGGYYGYARCALGPFGGYLVGCSGLWESINYFAIYIRRVGSMASFVFELEKKDSVKIWVCALIIIIAYHFIVHRFFYNSSVITAILSLIMLMVFLFGTMKDLDFETYGSHDPNGFFHSPGDFMNCLKLSIVFFLGFDMITITSSDVKDAKRTIPKVLIALIITMFVLATWTMFTVVSQYPGIVPKFYKQSVYFPLSFGYQNMFPSISKKQAYLIVISYPVVSAVTYLFVLAKQIKSMAKSGLLPPIFKITFGPGEFPLYQMILVAFITVYLNYFAMKINKQSVLTREASIAGCFVYLAMFYCYVIFRRRFGHLERGFHNPLKLWGAVIGAMIFAAILFMLLYFEQDQFFPITLMYFSYIGFMVIYYFIWVENHQFFSANEQKVFFKAYIVNMQIRKKKAIHKRLAMDVVGIFWATILPSSSRRSDNVNNSNNDSLVKNSDLKSKNSKNSKQSTSITGPTMDLYASKRVISEPSIPRVDTKDNVKPFESVLSQDLNETDRIIYEIAEHDELDQILENGPVMF